MLKTGCSNYGVGLLPTDVLRNQDSAGHPSYARFMICSATHKLTISGAGVWRLSELQGGESVSQTNLTEPLDIDKMKEMIKN